MTIQRVDTTKAIGLSTAFKGMLFFVALATSSASFAESYSGLVVSVADGDTVTVLDGTNQQHKVRLAGIDAPEKAQAFGNVSRQHLAQLVFQKQVTIEFEKHDRYRREVGKVLAAGRDINLQQIEAGLAWHYKKYQSEQPPADRPTYSAAESSAATERRGLWRDPSPTPPWEFRKLKRGGQSSESTNAGHQIVN